MRYSLLVILLIGWCLPAQSQVVYTTRAENYVREGAGSFFNLVAVVPKNTELKLLQKSRGWAKVTLPDKRTGWTAERSLTTTRPSGTYRDKLTTAKVESKVSKAGTSSAVKSLTPEESSESLKIPKSGDLVKSFLPGKVGNIAGKAGKQLLTPSTSSETPKEKITTATPSTKVSKVGISAAVKAFGKRIGNTADPEDVDYVVDAFELGPGNDAYMSFKQPLEQKSANKGKIDFSDLNLDAPQYDQNLNELKIGAGVSARILATFKVVKNRWLEEYLTLIASTLTENTDFYDWKFSIFVLDTPTANCFAAPGGYIFITRGLIQHCTDESELAAVIGHEIGHLIRRHGMQEITHREPDIKAEDAFDEVDSETGGKSDDEEELDEMAIESYNRCVHKRLFSYELEADKISAVLCANAGYDPYGIVRVSKTMQHLQASEPKPDIFDSEYFEQNDAKKRTSKIETFVGKNFAQRNPGQRLQNRFASRARL